MFKKQTKIMNVNGENEIKVSVSTVVYSLLIILVLTIAAGSILAYGTNTEIGKRISALISKAIPFPAAIVSWDHVVYLDDLESNLASVQRYYLSESFSKEGLRIDFTTEDGKKRLEIKKREILDKMVEDEIVEILAKQKGIEISQAKVDGAVDLKLEEFGTADTVKDDLLKSYGWTIEDFKKRVVLPSMYSQALADKVVGEQKTDTEAKRKIEKAQSELRSGVDFAQVVLKYSEGASKVEKGELGWVKKDQVLPELQDLIFGREPEKNTIIESSIGFHIFEIQDRKKENEENLLKLRQVFVVKNTFADWLNSEKKKMSVWVPLSEFVWDKNSAAIDFEGSEMREFEKRQREKAQGDASLMF